MRFLILVLLILSSGISVCQEWSSLNSQGLALYHQGKYIEAEPVMEQALRLAEEKYGKASDTYVTTLNNLAYLLQKKGDFEKSIGSFQEVCRLSRSVYGKSSIAYIESLINKANVFLHNGRYDSCEANLSRAKLLVKTEVLGNTHNYQKNSLSFFEGLARVELSEASLLYNRGQLNSAILLLEKQKKNLEDAYGKEANNSKTYFGILSNLSTYYLESGALDKAREVLLKNIEFEKQVYGVNSPQYYESQNSLGSIYRNSGMLDSARMIWQKVEKEISITDRAGGKPHLGILANLGELSIEIGDYPQAIKYLKKSKTLHQRRKSQIPRIYQITIFNLAEAYHSNGDYLQADQLYQELIGTLIDNVQHEFTYLSEEEKRAFYQDQLYYVEAYLAFAFEVSNLLPLQDSETPYTNPSIAGQLYDLQLMTKAIILNSSRRMKRHIMNSDNEALKKNYQLWIEKKNLLAMLYTSDDATIDEVSGLTAEVEELEADLSRQSRDFKSGFSIDKVTWQQVQQRLQPNEAAVEVIRILGGLAYMAVILTPETKQMPVLALAISTRSKHLEKEYFNLYKNAIQYQVEDTTSYQVYWKPIRDMILTNMPDNKMPETVYLSADGIYSQLNLHALFNHDSGQYLIDETNIHLLTNTKEIVQRGQHTRSRAHIGKAVLLGDPSFSVADPVNSKYFVRLAGTSREVLLIDKLLQGYGWDTETFRQENATVAQIRQSTDAHILHLATHGFFITNERENMMEVLLSSGLALAGANDLLSGRGDEGILTSYETATLDLDSAELVVLSACETGRGDYLPGEGVYGLQRAIKVAGAESIIMSLWKVDDEATQKLMVSFYKNWAPGVDKRHAFKKAQQQLREQYPQPFYWGAFIMMGE